jgi:hypothetical protein
MAMGEYTSEYTISSKNGTETNPITLTGPRTAIISNYGGLTLFGSNYWILDGIYFRINNSAKSFLKAFNN